ncbi:MAG: YcdB/YcdC domain-containing protein [Promethearchaeota archaeon]
MGKKNVTNKKSIVFAFFLIWLVLILPTYASGAMSSNEETIEQRMEDLALAFAEPKSNAELISTQFLGDDYLDQEFWCVRWTTSEHHIVEVKIDAISNEIVYFLDMDKKHAQNNDLHQMSEEAVKSRATDFLNKLEVFGYNPIPEDANLLETSEDEDGWQISWAHLVDTIPVLGDFIRIRVSQESGLVYSYTKCWHSVETMPEPLLTCSEVVDILHREEPISINMTIQCDLNVVGRFLDGRVSYEPQLAWVITAKSQYGGTIVYYIDASTGELIFRDSTLDIYEDVFTWDPNCNPTHECASEIYDRFDLATEWYARYYEEPTYYEEVNKLQYERVLYHLGHGGYGEYNSEMETFLCTDTDNIWAANVENLDLSGMDLAFLCGCWTFANNYPIYILWWIDHWEDIDLSLAEGFLEAGAQCVFGWDEEVLKTEAYAFSRYFFDYGVNSATFEECYDHAYANVDSETQDIARMDGDDTLTLDEYDYAGDSWGDARNLGSGYDKTFHVYDEGLWNPDVDWYRFTVTAYHDVDIWVVPNTDDLDVGFIVYNEYLQTVISRDAAGPGAQEWWYFTNGHGTYFLYIYKTDTHGGYYDLTVTISS